MIYGTPDEQAKRLIEEVNACEALADLSHDDIDAETAALFNERIIEAHGEQLRIAARQVANLRERGDHWRNWCLMACGAIAGDVIVSSILWGR